MFPLTAESSGFCVGVDTLTEAQREWWAESIASACGF
jgi:hypothetical protein